MATTSTSAAAATTTTASTTAAAANAKVKPALPDKSKNIPLITTIGFEVSTAATSTNSSTSTTAASGATQSNAVNSEGGEQTAQEKAKTYITDYDIKETLGEGSFGAVVWAIHKDTKQECAIKILNKAYIVKEKKEKYVKIERDVFSLCNHRNIVQLYKTFSSPENLYYVLEVCPNGELLSHIKKHGSFDVVSAAWYTGEIVNGLEHLHQLGIVHRDLKPENILMSKDMHAKLTDFGTSKILEGAIKDDPNGRLRTDSFVGTAEYIAPEMLDTHETCRASDLFALGSIIYQMITGRPPFKAKTDYLTIEKVKAFDYTFAEGFPSVAESLVRALIVRKPEDRLGAGVDGYEKLRAHELFATVDWSAMASGAPPPVTNQQFLFPANLSVFSTADTSQRIDAKDRLAGGSASPAAPDRSSAAKDAPLSTSGGVTLTFLSETEHDKWKAFLLADEKIIKSGLIYKYKGLSVKKRQLILTNKPRILYLSLAKQVVKGEIPWSSNIIAVAKNATSFTIQVPDRKYVLQDKDAHDADGWVKAIEQLKAFLSES